MHCLSQLVAGTLSRAGWFGTSRLSHLLRNKVRGEVEVATRVLGRVGLCVRVWDSLCMCTHTHTHTHTHARTHTHTHTHTATSLHAKFDITDGPSTPATATISFECDGATLSGLNFELSSSTYKISLLKFKCSSGKYTAEAS